MGATAPVRIASQWFCHVAVFLVNRAGGEPNRIRRNPDGRLAGSIVDK